MSLGRMRLRAEDYAGAEATLRPLTTGQRGGMARIALVQALIPQGKLTEARTLLASSSRGARTPSLVHRLYGDAFVAEEKWSAAEKSYRAAVSALREGGDEMLARIDAQKAANPKATGADLMKIYTDAFEARRAEQVAQRQAQDPAEARERRRAARAERRDGPNAERRRQVLQRLAQQRRANNATGTAAGPQAGGGLRARIQERRAQQAAGTAPAAAGGVTGEVIPPRGGGGGRLRNLIARRRGTPPGAQS